MSFLEEHFELLTRTPEDTARLKDLILQLAVQGKLVPQDSNDEPASVLLQQIKAEREMLLKDGKIKRQKPLPPITEDEIPYELPEGWMWCRFSEIFTTSTGGTPSRGNPDFWGGNIPWLKSGELTDDYIFNDSEEKITELGLKRSSAKVFEKGTLLLALYGATAGKLGILTYDTSTNQAICGIKKNSYIILWYTFYYLLGNRNKIVKDSFGGAQPNISQTYLKRLLFPLPPLNEQKRIVDRVKNLMAKVEKLKKANTDAILLRRELGKSMLHYLSNATGSQETQKYWHLIENNFEEVFTDLENVKELRKTCLQLAVQGKLVPQDPTDEPASALLGKIKAEKEKLINEGKIKRQKPLPPIKEDEIPYELPEGWVWCRLKAITHNFGQKKPNRKFTYIDVSSINNRIGSIDNNCQILLPEEAPSRARKIVKKNCVIYSTVRPYLLNITIIDRNFKYEPIVSTAFAVLNPILVNNKYFLFYLRSKVFTEYVEGQMIGMAYPAINDNKLYLGLIPLPPLNEQKRIVEKVDRLMRLCDRLEEKIKESDEKMEVMMRGVMG